MTEPTSINSIVSDATTRLVDVSESARLDAELLVARSINMPRSYLFAHPEDKLDESAQQRLEHILERRLRGEPMAYITGFKEFWSLELVVSPATLVPRPETEILVSLALQAIPRQAEWQVLDLGTGCGAIAVVIASERRNCEITAVDSSVDAIAVARQNVRQLDLSNVTCLDGDWTDPVQNRQFKVILSNPPYVRADDAALESLRAEPRKALVAGADGLDAIRILANDCVSIIADDGVLMLEHGADQKNSVADILTSCAWEQIQCHKDFAGNPRVTLARRSAGQP
ncbi:MAG: peptide chain release factor N(5)-glutamine methyltransferase [Proteobacteria bacterium]|nr:peptide chain release factor N(5)-glutamine methyltransferase [Pseudomonadota bacterium]